MESKETVICDKCNSTIEFNPNPDNALYVTLTGGYGMFIDLEMVELLFCHSCAVELFRTVPNLSADKMRGSHSVANDNKDYPLCCEYSWGIENDETIYGTEEHFKGRE
jgi:hypothetical protein